ncbi:hypothetical protein [Massilia sp. BJB1822]|uniref:hypothetical protein n=1 Tax=Massilia sp. BJB1822 TaxID=2744470 RepID=UPI0015942194|nr:hypothetical protein [Massilia sp. BJB1822]NVD96975.1 hypothetical protein [Massilia sp. BJB1822]
MASIQLTLPDDLAEQAAEFSLLDSSAIADLLRAEIRRQIMDKISRGIASLESSGDTPMSEEDIPVISLRMALNKIRARP